MFTQQGDKISLCMIQIKFGKDSFPYLTSSGKRYLSPGGTSKKKGKGSDKGSAKADTITLILNRFA
jgi:hypothetical protein